MSNINKNLSVHFIGVGGSGMSALCKYLLAKNMSVSGSDLVKSESVDNLISLGLKFYQGHEHNAVEFSDVIVYSSAISIDNKELVSARSLNKAIYSRAELLSLVLSAHKRSIGVSGSHGKTTTASLLNFVLVNAGIKVNSFIGGEDKFSNEYSFSNKSAVAVSEVCEFSKNISCVSCDYAVCLNIDNDHLDCYGTIENLSREFYSFLVRAKKKFINRDDGYLKSFKLKNSVTFGIEEKCDYRAVNLVDKGGCYCFDVEFKGEYLLSVDLKIPGRVNVYNALAVISILKTLFKIENHVIESSISNYMGVKRRFEYVGCIHGKRIICDYAHHPTEISALISTVKSIYNNDYLLVFEPHTYSRTKLLFNAFINVFEKEYVVLYKEFPSRESYDYKGSSKALHLGIKNSKYCENFDNLLEIIKNTNKANVIVIGAGELYEKFSRIKNGN